MDRAFFSTIEAGSRVGLVSKVNKYFAKRNYMPAMFQISVEDGRHIFYYWGKLDNYETGEVVSNGDN